MASHSKIFFNTKIEDFTMLSQFADNCLAPYRYLFNGRDVRVIVTKQNKTEVVSCPSFYARDPEFKQNSRHWLRGVSAIVLLIPSVFLGTFVKIISYKDREVRERHRLAKTHLTRVPLVIIADQLSPFSTEAQVIATCQNIFDNDLLHRRINTLVIHGRSLELCSGLNEFLDLKKLILVNGRILPGDIDNLLASTKKWYIGKYKGYPFETRLTQISLRTIEEAKKAVRPRRGNWFSFKRFRVVYNIRN